MRFWVHPRWLSKKATTWDLVKTFNKFARRSVKFKDPWTNKLKIVFIQTKKYYLFDLPASRQNWSQPEFLSRTQRHFVEVNFLTLSPNKAKGLRKDWKLFSLAEVKVLSEYFVPRQLQISPDPLKKLPANISFSRHFWNDIYKNKPAVTPRKILVGQDPVNYLAIIGIDTIDN